jgi:hypothetical protein
VLALEKLFEIVVVNPEWRYILSVVSSILNVFVPSQETPSSPLLGLEKLLETVVENPVCLYNLALQSALIIFPAILF